MIMVTVQVANLSHKKVQAESCGGDLVDVQIGLVPSQVMNANPSDSQVYWEHNATYYHYCTLDVSRVLITELNK